MTRGPSPCFYIQRYEVSTNIANKIDIWAVLVDEWLSQHIIWRQPTTMKNTRGEFEGGIQPPLNKK